MLARSRIQGVENKKKVAKPRTIQTKGKQEEKRYEQIPAKRRTRPSNKRESKGLDYNEGKHTESKRQHKGGEGKKLIPEKG